MQKLELRFYAEMVGDIVEAKEIMIDYAASPYPSNYFIGKTVEINSQDIADLAQTMKAREDYILDRYSIRIKLYKLCKNIYKKLKRIKI